MSRRLYRLASFNILANVTVPLASLVDTAILGHLEEIRFLAGVALAAVLFEYVYWTFGFLRMGTTGITAQAVGRGDRSEEFLTLYRSLLLAVSIGFVLLTAQTLFREGGFALLSGSEEVEAAGRAYFDGRIWAAPATLCNFVILGWFLGRERSDRALQITIVANVANIVLDYFFIIRLGWAAFGAGLATALSQYLALITSLGLVLVEPAIPRPRWPEIWQPDRLWGLARLNRDILLRTVMLVTTFAIFTNVSSIFGTVMLAANSILLRFLALAAYLIDGLAFAVESLAGIFRGRRDVAGLAELRRLALRSGLVFTLPILAPLVLFSGPILGLLTNHEQTLAAAALYLLWLVPTLLLASIAYIYDGLFLGLTEGRALRNSMLMSTLLVFAPLAWLSIRTQNNHLLWASLAAFMAARALSLHFAQRRLFAELRLL